MDRSEEIEHMLNRLSLDEQTQGQVLKILIESQQSIIGKLNQLLENNMQRYRTRKMVHAEEMSYSHYVQFRLNNNVRSSDVDCDDPGSDGYHIVYSMGEDDEYHSWSPKRVFEASAELVGDGE